MQLEQSEEKWTVGVSQGKPRRKVRVKVKTALVLLSRPVLGTPRVWSLERWGKEERKRKEDRIFCRLHP